MKIANMDEDLKLDFLSSFTHELKTPINIILSTVQLMKYKDHGGENNDYYRYIEDNSYRLLRMVCNIIDVSRLSGGAFEVHRETADYVEFVGELCEGVRVYSSAKHIEIDFKNECSDGIFDFDFSGMEKVLLNLLSNSINYTENGGKITVRVWREGDKICTSVEDNGCGIPKEKYSLVFKKYAEINYSSFDSKQGSGIGLFLVKKYIDAMDGEIFFTSTSGKGTTFTIELPIINNITSQFRQYMPVKINSNELRIQMSCIKE